MPIETGACSYSRRGLFFPPFKIDCLFGKPDRLSLSALLFFPMAGKEVCQKYRIILRPKHYMQTGALGPACGLNQQSVEAG